MRIGGRREALVNALAGVPEYVWLILLGVVALGLLWLVVRRLRTTR